MSSQSVESIRFNSVTAALCGALTGSVAVMPAQAQTSSITQLAPVEVQGEYVPFQPTDVQSPKFVAPLLDTPQTINVVPAEVLREQNAQTLQEILSNVPGITFSSGEGGAGWGDMFTIRGFSAEQSVTYDGVRNSALSTRTDTFNIEQVEVFKGTGSVESGVAAVGGMVNLVEKAPRAETFYNASTTLGTDQYRRITADINQQITDSIAFRLNAMGHHNHVAERNYVQYKRWGVAPSLTFGLGTPTRITLKYFHQKDINVPDFGVPVARGTGGDRMQWIGRDFWGGLKGVDREETRNDAASLIVEHDVGQTARIRNQTRWSQTKRFTYLTTGGRLLNAPPGAQPGDDVPGNTNNYWGYGPGGGLTYPSGPIALPRLQGNINAYRGKILANQTDLNFDFSTGGFKHRMATGIEVYRESYRKDPYSVSAPSISGRRVIDVRNPDVHYTGPWHTVTSDDRSGAEVTNVGVYVYDSVELSRHWEVAGGLRYDRFHVKWYDTAGRRADYEQKDGVWSGRIGVVYKPVDYGSIYVAYSQATQPSAAAAASRSGGGGNANVADYSPAKAKTYEVGTKWDLLNERLSLTGAIFQVERTNPTDTNPDDPTGTPLQFAGKDRVQGIELGLAGNVTSWWSVYGGLAFMRSKIVEDASDPTQEGGKLKNVPNATVNLWTTYAFTPRLSASLGVQYVGKRRFAAGNTVAARAPISSGPVSADEYMPAYWLANAAIGYQVNDNVGLRVNINNLFNKFYYSQGSSSSDGFQLFGVPGPGRTVMLTAEITY